MIEASLNVVLHLCEGTAHIFLGALLARPDNGERAMSLRSVTAKIDNVIFAAFVAICLLIWAVLGFPLVIEIAMTAASVVVIFFFVSWMELDMSETHVAYWPVADLRDERADVRFVGWSGLALMDWRGRLLTLSGNSSTRSACPQQISAVTLPTLRGLRWPTY